MVARPATAPVTMPTDVGLPERIHSSAIQAIAATDAASCVARIAFPACTLAASALPPLKPNQPTHSMPAPAIVIDGLCGGTRRVGNPLRGPTISAVTSALTPAVLCTTTPPA